MKNILTSVFVFLSAAAFSQTDSLKVQDSLQVEKQIKEVTIVGQKKLIERKVDRLVFDVTNLPTADGGNALDVLKITPGLTVSDTGIKMIGKSYANVMIDDKIINFSEEELINFLKGLRANDIQNIEVITTPPAKYEAEGNSGLINIVMKRAKNDTWSASLFSNYTQAKYMRGTFGGSFNYRKKNLSFYANASYDGGDFYNKENSKIYYPILKWDGKNSYKYKTDLLSARTGLDVDISKNWTVGAQYMGSFSNPSSKNADHTDIFNISDGSKTAYILTDGNSGGNRNLNSGNFHSLIKLDTLGRKINFDFDILDYLNNHNRVYSANTFDSQTPEIENGLASSEQRINRRITNYSTQIDVEHPFKKFNLNYGMKLSFSNTDNDIYVYDTSSGTPELDENQTNKFLYKENTQAFYLSANTKFGKDKWELQAGLRTENTQFEGNSVTLNEVHKDSYLKFFPTVYLSYKPKEKHNFYAEYGRRVSRPGFNELNPFRSYTSPYYSFEGNPELKPTFTTNISLGYIYNNIFQAALWYSRDEDNRSAVIITDDEPFVQRAVRMNYFDDYSMGAGLFYSYNKLKWWTSQNSVNLYFQHSDSKIYPITPKSMEGYGGSFRTYNIFYLNEKKTISTGFDFSYVPPNKSSDLVYNYTRTQLDAFFKMLFFEKKLSVTLTGNNLLKENSYHNKSERNKNITYMKGDNNMYFRLALSYTFGSNKVNVKQRQISNEDEKNRVN
ncbi:MAG: outer membrane beta-barrel family protein [Flavobacteriaceae bacterium]|jgi:outer membrane receptor protein involved in Fe transport|nr:outer membrane beta-barrel family protein [Flavobacteriaceae bacterium]